MTNPERSGREPAPHDHVSSLVGEYMQEKKREKESEVSSGGKRRSPTTIGALFLLCLAVWVAPSLMLPPAPVPTTGELERGARLYLYLTSLQVRQFQDSTQRLPASLSEAGADTTGVDYSQADSIFELSTSIAGTRLVYRSTLPDSVFLGGLRVRGIS